MSDYTFAEAFHLMLYRCNRGHSEKIWNSRDGVTPFCVNCLQCDEELQHVNWKGDVRMLDYHLKSGDRFFRDGTSDEAREILKRRIEQGRETYPLSLEEEQQMIAEVEGWEEFRPGWPMLVVQP